MSENCCWHSIPEGTSALSIIGAGFPIGILNEAPPSTYDILQQASNKYPNEYPIITEIVKCNNYRKIGLNKLWSDIRNFSASVSYAYSKIFNHHMNTSSNMKEFYACYSNAGISPKVILWIGLGLELKKAICHFYGNSNKGNFRQNVKNIDNIIKKFNTRYWVSLNYDLVLEEALLELLNLSSFNANTNSIRYLNEEFVNHSINDPKQAAEDIIIKPHGSINLSFETEKNQDTYTHFLKFVNRNDYLKSFDHNKIGYENKGCFIYESRPCIIGYVPDDYKDELNSKSYYSDIAHDFCKLQMGSLVFAMNEAKSIFILGYSMPKEDEWIWKRVKDIQDKNKPIRICCGEHSQRIVKLICENGFKNVNIINNGRI